MRYLLAFTLCLTGLAAPAWAEPVMATKAKAKFLGVRVTPEGQTFFKVQLLEPVTEQYSVFNEATEQHEVGQELKLAKGHTKEYEQDLKGAGLMKGGKKLDVTINQKSGQAEWHKTPLKPGVAATIAFYCFKDAGAMGTGCYLYRFELP